jgi:hypothetical protein
MDFGLSSLIAIQKWHMMIEQTAYTPEEMWALTFASHLDKSKGLDNGSNVGYSFNKKDELITHPLIYDSMGMMM